MDEVLANKARTEQQAQEPAAELSVYERLGSSIERSARLAGTDSTHAARARASEQGRVPPTRAGREGPLRNR